MIPIAQHVKNISRMRVHKDGNAFFVAFDDFVDLQKSPAFFIENERANTVFARWCGISRNPLVHLIHEDRCYLSRQLMRQERA